MTSRPLRIVFLWHMHQPNYKDPLTGVFRLPWVRLHGVKDYLDMVEILDDFPAIHQTFNLVPSLLAQLTDYLDNSASDRYLDLTLKNPSDMTEGEKLFVVENFFLANWDNLIKPFPRYYELLTKRGFRFTKADVKRVTKYFTNEDVRDLQVLFNLSWIDPMYRSADPFLTELAAKGKDYTEEEKEILIGKQFEILRRIIPAYKSARDRGQIEISVTPFYHPILPLLWDTESARMSMPQVRLPRQRFRHPEDATAQIRMGIEYFEKLFGFRAQGMWPSEGSVSEDVLHAIAAEGITWVATDEEILARSIGWPLRSPEGYPTEPAMLYRPYEYGGVSIFFRDHKLSDLIGFVYSGWDAGRAVDDFMAKLLSVRNSLPGDRDFVVPIILDGENAWEYYRNDGHDFLRGLYHALSNDDRFKTVTCSEFLRESEPEHLHRLHTGSWINANFGIWIGHEEDNLAWDYLSMTRDDLAAFQAANPGLDLSEAWDALYAAEGSDWNWWYGDDHATETQEDFDELFRGYLMKVYKVMNRDIPYQLHIPILIEDRSVMPSTLIRGFIHPKIDGFVTSYFEWHQAASLDMKRSGGSMHKSESLISALYFGFDKDTLYLRADPATPFSEMKERVMVNINLVVGNTFRVVCNLMSKPPAALLFEKKGEEWSAGTTVPDVAAEDVFEIAIPFSMVRGNVNDEIHLSLDVIRNGKEMMSPREQAIKGVESVDRCPWRGYITITVPSPDYEILMWY